MAAALYSLLFDTADMALSSAGGSEMTVEREMSDSYFFNRVEDHLLAMLFAHLPGKDAARLAYVCKRWREVVQGDGSEENIWKVLWKRDFEGYTHELTSTPWPNAPSARYQYASMAAVDDLSCPVWKQVHPTNGQRTVMDRQGSSAAVLNGCAVVYGGWTSGWDTIRNDVHILRSVKRDNGRKVIEWEFIKCRGDFPPPTYGPTVTTLIHPSHGPCLATFGGVLYGSYQGPMNELRLLIPHPSEFASSQQGGGAGGGEGVRAGKTQEIWNWINPPQRSELAGTISQ